MEQAHGYSVSHVGMRIRSQNCLIGRCQDTYQIQLVEPKNTVL